MRADRGTDARGAGLDPPARDRLRLERMVAALLARYRRGRATARILPAARAAWRRFREPVPWKGQGLPRLRRDLDALLDLTRRNDSPRFWGYVSPPGTEVGALADWLAAGLNQNLTSWRSAPGATLVELQVIDWIREIVGFPRGSAGLLTSGGSIANLAGLAAAREAAFPAAHEVGRRGLRAAPGRPLVLYASEQAHHSVLKAVALLGIGTDQVRSLPTDRRLRLDPRALREALRTDRRARLRPFCVVANAGSVETGAVDPLRELARICRRERLWLHVDACYGGFAILAPSARPLLRGIGLADSLALDPHKWLYAPLDAGCVLYRDPGPARRAFRLDASYTRTFGRSALENFAFWDHGPELSRRFRALKIWMTLKYHGVDAVARAIEEDIRLARALERRVLASPRLELLVRGDLSIVCFRYVPGGARRPESDLERLNHEVLLGLQREGRAFVSNARVRGRFALRACIINYRTTEADLDLLVDRVLTWGRRAEGRTGS
jgi:glutamate/tyrosine decarboxylase-like PLP-dependent enzyme